MTKLAREGLDQRFKELIGFVKYPIDKRPLQGSGWRWRSASS